MCPRFSPEELRKTLSIPTLPQVVNRISRMVDDPNVGMKEVGEAISEDAPITANVLRVANSSLYGLQEKVSTAEQAATVLGAHTLRNLALQAAVIREYEHLTSLKGFDVRDLWRHAVLTARTAQFLTRRCRAQPQLRGDEVYTCGLLHDIGRVVLLDNLGLAYLTLAGSGGELPEESVEKEVFGLAHTEVGAMVASRWKMPADIVTGARFHHGPHATSGAFPVVAVVAHADRIAKRVVEADIEELAVEDVMEGATRLALGVSPKDVGAVVEFAAENAPRIEL